MMKTIEWVVLGIMTVALMLLCAVAGGFAAYTVMYPRTLVPAPEIIQVPQIIEKEVQVPIEVIKTVEVEKIVIQTPAVVELAAPTEVAPELVFTEAPIEPPCTNVAWVVSQPKSDLQAGAMKAGTIKRLRFRLRNEGTCTWDNYVLTSAGVLPDMPVPYTLPGEIAEIVYDFQVYRSLEARFVLQPPTISGLFGVMNAASPGVGEEPIYYRLDVYKGSSLIQIPAELGGGTIRCGPGG